MRLNRNPSPCAGFTLVELLVAFSILLVGMTGIVGLFSAGLNLARDAEVELDAAAAQAELQDLVRERLRALTRDGGDGEIHLEREPVPGREGLEYAVDAMPYPGEVGKPGWLVRIRVIPRGAAEDEGYDWGYLPMSLRPSFEELVRKSSSRLEPLDGAKTERQR